MNIDQMSLADFAKLDDIKKTVVVELHPGIQLNEETWTQHGVSTNAWYLTLTDGEIDRVDLDGVELDEEFSIVDCHGNADSFYYDDLSQILYIHTTGSDDPATLVSSYPKYCIVAYFWIITSNRAVEVQRRKQILDDGIFNFWDSATDLEFWTEFLAGGTSAIDRDTTIYDSEIEVYSAKITIDAAPNAALIRQDKDSKPQRKHIIKIRYQSDGVGMVRLLDTGANVYLTTGSLWQAGAANCINIADTSGAWVTAEIEFVTHPSYEDYRIMVRSASANVEVIVSRIEFWRYYQPIQAKGLLSLSAIPAITQSVGVYYYPENQISFGDIEMNDDGYFISNREDYLWHNKEVIVRVGDLDSDYEDFPIFFYGYLRSPTWSAGTFKFSVVDRRLELKRLPIGTFNTTDFANIEADWEDRPIPILLGDGGTTTPILPPCIDTSSFIYKVTEVTFGGITYEIYSIDSVYKDGKTLATPADYSVDLTNGQFTLVADPEDSEITCKANGIESSQFGDNYAGYPADFLFFYLCIANGIDKQRLNWASFVDLYTNRQLLLRSYIDEEIDTIDLLDELQRSAVFQLFVRLDGTIEARRYSSDVPTGVRSFVSSDFEWWEIVEDTDHCYRDLIIRYEFNEISKMFDAETTEEDHTPPASVKIPYADYEHGVKSKLTIETIHTTTFQAQELWDNSAAMVQNPMEILRGKLNVPEALLLNPTDKIKIYIEKTIDETKHVIYNDETFQIMSITKNIADCSADIIAFRGVSIFYWEIT